MIQGFSCMWPISRNVVDLITVCPVTLGSDTRAWRMVTQLQDISAPRPRMPRERLPLPELGRGAICNNMPMSRQPTLVQLSDELLAALDQRAGQIGQSRSALIRQAIESFLADDREAAIDRAIAEGYARVPADPSTELEVEAARLSVAAEPW